MSINLTDEIEVKTKKGKLGAAKQIFLEGDTQTVEKEIQEINSRHNDLSSTVSEHTKQIGRNQSQITANKSTQDEKNASLDSNMAKLNTRDDQITELIKGVTATGGASVATAVTYDNTSSQLTSATVQGAVDELQGSKINKTSISQEFGDAEDKVMSQKATTTAIADETTRAKAAEEAIIFDVSANNNGAVFESISALLSSSDLSTLIPTSVRHGGMSIRFIQSSDNKYVQYRLMSTDWSITENDWQGVDDEPTAGSDNLVKSGGVANKIAELEDNVYSYKESEITDYGVVDNIRTVSGSSFKQDTGYTIKYKKFDSSTKLKVVIVSKRNPFTTVVKTDSIDNIVNGGTCTFIANCGNGNQSNPNIQELVIDVNAGDVICWQYAAAQGVVTIDPTVYYLTKQNVFEVVKETTNFLQEEIDEINNTSIPKLRDDIENLCYINEKYIFEPEGTIDNIRIAGNLSASSFKTDNGYNIKYKVFDKPQDIKVTVTSMRPAPIVVIASTDSIDNIVNGVSCKGYILSPNGSSSSPVSETYDLHIEDKVICWLDALNIEIKIEGNVLKPIIESVEKLENDTAKMVEKLENDTKKLLKASTWEMKGENRETALRQQFLDSGEKAHWYGVTWKEEDNADNVTAINSNGDDALHETLPIQNKMRRCVINKGIVQYYLDANNSNFKDDGTPAHLDGTDGNVFVEIPEFFYRCESEMIGDVRTIRLKISEQGLPGFNFSRKRFTSAYEATVNRDINKLASVCTTVFSSNTEELKIRNMTNYIEDVNGYSLGTHKIYERSNFTSNAAKYRGGVNDASLDSETDPSSQNYSRNQLGIPVANVNRSECRKLADIDNGDFMYQYDTQKALWILSQVEFKTRNVQTSILGLGATQYSNYVGFENYFTPKGGISCLPCGITNELGNQSGYVYYRMKNVPIETDRTTLAHTKWGNYIMPVMSYRGVENFYGHIYKIADGINAITYWDGVSYASGHEGDYVYSSCDQKFYYQPNPYFTDDAARDSELISNAKFPTNTFIIKKMLLDEKANPLPIDTDWQNNNRNNNYCDCLEAPRMFIKDSKVRYITYNGRIVSSTLVGWHFIVAGHYAGENEDARPSDGTRIDRF